MPSDVAILTGALVFVFVLALVPVVFGRRIIERFVHGSAEHQARLEELTRIGSKARATVLAVTPTGTVVDRVNLQCVIRFRLDPLDSSPDFEIDKTVFVPQGQLPPPGAVWPAWYDQTDRTEVAVARPDPSDPETAGRLEEFSIPNSLAAVPHGSAGVASEAAGSQSR